jgi:glycosyltransferase involved in cell wall biosynthesis
MPTVDVSILMTCHDKEEYLDEAINSVLDQTYKPKEIIVVHDNCKNPAHHSKATSIMLPRNVGVSEARRKAFDYSSGEFVLFFDADDRLYPDYIERMINIKGDIIYPDMFLWYVHGPYQGENKLIITPEKLTAKSMWHHCQIPVTALMHRETFQELGGFKTMDVYEDWEFWLRAMEAKKKFVKAPTTLMYRQISGSRNRLEMEQRRQVHLKIQSMYEVKGNKLCKK